MKEKVTGEEKEKEKEKEKGVMEKVGDKLTEAKDGVVGYFSKEGDKDNKDKK